MVTNACSNVSQKLHHPVMDFFKTLVSSTGRCNVVSNHQLRGSKNRLVLRNKYKYQGVMYLLTLAVVVLLVHFTSSQHMDERDQLIRSLLTKLRGVSHKHLKNWNIVISAHQLYEILLKRKLKKNSFNERKNVRPDVCKLKICTLMV
ncbi:uncharacterized protein LOC143229679 isoform X1 [Tachypleus tridentatus]|uniref:uncharacterized protein LOC143229679 isoform X1 n=1 Tax=Tachypleus tridentatus TaxID=6853 RepID=UPI003FD664B1